MTDLTEKWKNGELVEGIYYYIKVNDKVIPARLSKYGNFYLTEGACGRNAMRKVEEVLAPVPSYEEWQTLNKEIDKLMDVSGVLAKNLKPFTDDCFDSLTTKDIAELAKKSIRLTTQHCEDNAEIDKLKELLEKASYYLISYKNNDTLPERAFYEEEVSEFLEKIDEALK